MLSKWLIARSRVLHQPRKRMFSLLNSLVRRGHKDFQDCKEKLPTRAEHLVCLKDEKFDVLVIGGGSVGCGCALEAASRGLKTALIEAQDFGNGSSCKSSKLIEGSNSYINAAIQGGDLQQIFMLQQVLSERATLMGNAPHLSRMQPMLMPVYSLLRLPVYWLGLKIYDAMAGMSNLRGSHFISKEATLNEFPLLRQEGLLGSLVYYDCQIDDARMCLSMALTAAKHGATIANYVQLMALNEPESKGDSRVAEVRDSIRNKAFCITSQCVINATGSGTDAIRKLDDCTLDAISLPSTCTHIALPTYYGSSNCGIVLPTTDGQPLIMLPFENHLIVGSMDVERTPCCKPNYQILPDPEEISCLLEQTRGAFDKCVQLRQDHVLSAWSGVRPQIICPDSKKNGESEKIVTNYLVEVSDNQLITLAGGHWNTYRVMAADAIDTAIDQCILEPQSKASSTQNILLDGAEDYHSMLPIDLLQSYDLPMDVAQHLSDSYGSNAYRVLSGADNCDKRRLHPDFPYIEAEVIYACKREYACSVVDVIARRLRVAFVNVAAALEMLPAVAAIMSDQLDWTCKEQDKQLLAARDFLVEEMGLYSIVQQKRQPCCPNKQGIQGTTKEGSGSRLSTRSLSSIITERAKNTQFPEKKSISKEPRQAISLCSMKGGSHMESTNGSTTGFVVTETIQVPAFPHTNNDTYPKNEGLRKEKQPGHDYSPGLTTKKNDTASKVQAKLSSPPSESADASTTELVVPQEVATFSETVMETLHKNDAFTLKFQKHKEGSSSPCLNQKSTAPSSSISGNNIEIQDIGARNLISKVDGSAKEDTNVSIKTDSTCNSLAENFTGMLEKASVHDKSIIIKTVNGLESQKSIASLTSDETKTLIDLIVLALKAELKKSKRKQRDDKPVEAPLSRGRITSLNRNSKPDTAWPKY